MEPIPRNRANYLQAYVRLGHRIDLAEGHTLAGRILEKMLDSHETWGLYETDGLDGWSGRGTPEYYRQISEFEEAYTVDYPRCLRTIQEVIERRCKVIEPDT